MTSQHEAWLRKDEVFVKVGAGFLGILRRSTSVRDYQVIDYDLTESEDFAFTDTGRVVLKSHPRAETIAPSVRDPDAPEKKIRRRKR